jgi:glycosyltransferase involved in cell wall biosynthesis
MSKSTSFSVVIPTYNRELLLKRALDSALQQTYAEYELLIIDDGSTDGTADLVRSYSAQAGSRIRYEWQTNRGYTAALNRGLELASGDWVAFLDSDDYWVPEKLELQARAIGRFGSEAGVCFADARYLNNPQLTMTAFEHDQKHYEQEEGLVQDPAALILSRNHGIYLQSLAADRRVVLATGFFDPHLRVGGDTDYLLRLSLRTKFCYVNKPLSYIDRTVGRKDGLIELLADDPTRLEQRKYLYELWLTYDGVSGEVAREVHTQLAMVHNDWASYYLRESDYAKAREETSIAIHHRLNCKVLAKWMMARFAPGVFGAILRKRRLARPYVPY